MSTGEDMARAAMAEIARREREVAQTRELLRGAAPIAAEAGFSFAQLSDAWGIPRALIRDHVDDLHRKRRGR